MYVHFSVFRSKLHCNHLRLDMYAIRFTLFSPSLASAAGAVVKQQTVTLGRWPVKLSANKIVCLRGFASESGSRTSTLKRVKTASLKERLMAPAGDSGLQRVVMGFDLNLWYWCHLSNFLLSASTSNSFCKHHSLFLRLLMPPTLGKGQ